MKDSFKDYTSKILNDYLKLQRGDSLSVNTEEVNLEEAKYLASKAIDITGVNVKIVTTLNGKPQEVIEFDAPEQLTTPVTGLAMVRLVDDTSFFTEDPSLIESNNLPFLQKTGHLAEPLEISRRIAVPWCVANVNSTGPKLNENVKTIAKLTDEVRYRESYMRHMDIHAVKITGKDCDFSFNVPEDVCFVSGIRTLSNGRSFLTCDDFDKLSFTVDKNSANGKFSALTDIAGVKKNISFVFEDGKLVSHTEDSVLEKILSLDNEISKIGLARFRDGEVEILLGGSDTKSLAEIPESEEDLPPEFNTSLFSVKCSLGNDLNVVVFDCDGHEKELIRKGFFVE